MHDRSGHAHAAAPTPIPGVLAFTFVNSFATGATFNGVFFITERFYGMREAANLALGLALGVTYTAGAMASGPLLAALSRRHPGLSARGVVAGLMVAAGLLCFLPLGVYALAGRETGSWPIWLFVALYSPLTGALWPIVESYLSGGRSGARLRSAMGLFNITWSSALVVTLWAMAPMLERAPLWVMAAQGLSHAASIAALAWFERAPARHLEESRGAVPDAYHRLLWAHRILLTTGYLVMYALSPLLPALIAQLRLDSFWGAPAASTWLAARVGMFALMGRWHGWHGRWWVPAVAVTAMLAGFAGAVLAPQLLEGGAAIALMLAGLAAFGAGIAAIYAGALYYVMEVGSAEVEAGGSHEALIGLGYTLGPLCGLAGFGAGAAGLIDPGRSLNVMLALVGLLCAGAIALAIRRPPARRAGAA